MAGLRRQIGFVLQDQYVFADSIARNIAFGEDEPDMARVLGAEGWLSPVPGGVGPMTVTMLLLNVVQASERLVGIAGVGGGWGES